HNRRQYSPLRIDKLYPCPSSAHSTHSHLEKHVRNNLCPSYLYYVIKPFRVKRHPISVPLYQIVAGIHSSNLKFVVPFPLEQRPSLYLANTCHHAMILHILNHKVSWPIVYLLLRL